MIGYKAFGDVVELVERGETIVKVRFPDGAEDWIPDCELESFQSGLKRKAIKKVNKKRRAKSYKRNFHSEARVLMIKNTPCEVCWATPSDNAHVVSRGAGGDWRQIVPLCKTHHAEQHSIGNKAFEIKYHVDLTKLAEKYAKLVP